MRAWWVAAWVAAGIAVAGSAAAQPAFPPAREARLVDFDAFCDFVASHYAYFDRKTTDWGAACAASRDTAGAASTRDAFIATLERTLRELYDAHANLGTSNAASARLVPTDADVVARWRGEAIVMTDVREGSSAEAAGVRPGMTVVAIDDLAPRDAARPWMPTTLRAPDTAADDYALQIALAGRQDRRPVRIDVDDRGERRTIAYLPQVRRPQTPVTTTRVGDVVVIRLDNSLGDDRTVAAFDAALDPNLDARALVVDLRDTPSGGSSSVARGIMGRLVSHEAAYQRHERVSEERESGIRRVWVEYVEPRGRAFEGRVVVLVGPWTGSMGEGLAIGLHAARQATVAGRPMAHLLGALDQITLSNTGIVVRVPAEKLFHVDGTPREAFVPRPLAIDPTDDDPELAAAIRPHAMSASRRASARWADGCDGSGVRGEGHRNSGICATTSSRVSRGNQPAYM